MTSSKVLWIENAGIGPEALAELQSRGNLDITTASSGESALRKVRGAWDLIVLPFPLFDVATRSVLHYIRQEPGYPPVFIVSADPKVETKLEFFRQGCDDYLAQPILGEEFLVRATALLRRGRSAAPRARAYHDLLLDPLSLRLQTKCDAVRLTPIEMAMCDILMLLAEKNVTKRELIQGVWGRKEYPGTNSFEVHLYNLRRKLDQLGRDSWLTRQRGGTFILSRPSEKTASAALPAKYYRTGPN